jgi:hypothetical protein
MLDLLDTISLSKSLTFRFELKHDTDFNIIVKSVPNCVVIFRTNLGFRPLKVKQIEFSAHKDPDEKDGFLLFEELNDISLLVVETGKMSSSETFKFGKNYTLAIPKNDVESC